MLRVSAKYLKCYELQRKTMEMQLSLCDGPFSDGAIIPVIAEAMGTTACISLSLLRTKLLEQIAI